MKRLFLPTSSLVLAVGLATARVPDNLVTEGLPAIPLELRAGAGRYLEFRAAAFNGWHPRKREMLITTRFADSPQLHLVKMPGGARKQLAFLPEPVARGAFQPKRGECIVYTQDIGVAIARLQSDPKLEGERIAVMGGSYGGFMVLASMAAYSETLRAGVDVVGISNFLTFLKNTQDYRRDLRRAEYGDERDEKMRVFLEKARIRNPEDHAQPNRSTVRQRQLFRHLSRSLGGLEQIQSRPCPGLRG